MARPLILIGCVLSALCLVQPGIAFEPQQDPAAHFDRTLAPLLARKCLGCHNGSERSGGLDLSSAAASQAGGDSGVVIVAGDAESSLLWQRIEADEMPPEHPLAGAERAIVRDWIASGAVWGTSPIEYLRFSTDARAGYDWWSLQIPKRPTLPRIPQGVSPETQAWPKNPIDHFILAGLVEHDLTPSPEADRRTLIRRLSYDLLGLPPTSAEVEAFERDRSSDAYERLVDRLLASPQYGVRWARHWLDVVRFGESNGFEYDEFRSGAWPYRDWVVEALNRDLPYDEFARLQIAGDILRPNDLDAALATGFLVAGAFDTVGQGQQSEAMRAVARQDELEELIGVLGQTFLGLTVQCARCHDHKFDPIGQREYYQIAAALAGVRHGERELRDFTASGERAQQIAQAKSERARLKRELAAWTDSLRARLKTRDARSAKDLRPWMSWDFRTPDDVDPTGAMALHGGAVRTARGLELNGETAYAATPPIPSEVTAKTLEVVLVLSDLDQRGGAAMSLQSLDGSSFDAIVFGERQRRRWMAGSENFVRTRDLQGKEEDAQDRAVHVCITYAADGTIACYRDGILYGTSYKVAGVKAFAAGQSQVVFGLRHVPAARGKMLAGVVQRAALYDRALTPDEVAIAAGTITADVRRTLMSDQEQSLHDATLRALKAVDARLALLHPARGYIVNGSEPDATYLLERGEAAMRGEPVEPRGIDALATVDADWGLTQEASDAARRKHLADWIADAQNPLFARVMVNRVWHYHFGVGLVDTPNDFGFNGGRPVNQQLLDYLTTDFTAQGYRLKPLHRRIVTSATYRQAWRRDALAEGIDADNRLHWRGPLRRLEAEAVRDTMLAVAGVLDLRMGGPSFHDMKYSVAPGTATYLYAPDDPTRPEFHRRTLYRAWARSGRSAMLDVLDCPDPSATAPRRAVTTTPLQALTLLNNALALHLSDRFAARLDREAGGEAEAQVHRAYQLMFGRDPTVEELNLATESVRRHGLTVLTRALFNSNEFLYVD